MSNTVTLGQITELPPGDKDNPQWINDDFEAIVTNVKENSMKNSGKKYFTATLQDPHSTNITLDATFWCLGVTRFQGKVCRFSGQGMSLGEYKGNVKLTIGEKCKINVVGGAPATSTPTRTSAPAGGQGRPAAAPASGPIFGATVGMAINQAIGIIKDTCPDATLPTYYLTADFSKDLHTLASDILRVAALLEKGKLAPAVKDRQPAPPPPAPEPEPEPVHEDQATNPGPSMLDDGTDVPFAPACM
jgi:hypothetical protein